MVMVLMAMVTMIAVAILTSAAAQTLWSGSTATSLAELFCMTATSQVVVPNLLPTSRTESDGWMALRTASCVRSSI